ncbi:hypothetical protein CgunFtcFv8_002996 [Champsocephalus gunnari]|uniref:Uncharacterized protein n=1 Tax=Champsocephalus gunnari TaxID=52237 RepID=A0AAN8HJ32_CHAGU|nr:hypothetical protein CgunFtcFv8_002996 [Champsocephalus gunnari]
MPNVNGTTSAISWSPKHSKQRWWRPAPAIKPGQVHGRASSNGTSAPEKIIRILISYTAGRVSALSEETLEALALGRMIHLSWIKPPTFSSMS